MTESNPETNLYKQTPLQKLLGRHYKWWYIVIHSLVSETGGKIGFLSGYFATVVRIVSTSYIWFLAGADSNLFTYLLIGNLYSKITFNVYYYRLSSAIYSGKISSKLMYPLSFFQIEYFQAIGIRLTKNIFSLGGVFVGILICSLTFIKLNNPSWGVLLVVLTFPIAFTINHFLGILVGSLSFWIKNEFDYEGFRESYEAVFYVAIGVVIPLNKFQEVIASVLQFLPTPFLLHHPMQIYLGKYSALEAIYVFTGGIA